MFTPLHHGGAGPPMVLLHGFTDTWRTWELVLPALEARHEVLAPTLAGHAGGPGVDGAVDDDTLADAVERAMDDAGFETAHLVGNSLGGFLALQLAARGRARSVVALAPAGGWAQDDTSYEDALEHFTVTRRLLEAALPHVDTIVSTPEGRRRATAYITTNHEHLEPDLVAHMMRGAAGCRGMVAFIEHARERGWPLDPARVDCPVRFVWGTADRLLPWPRAARRYLADFPTADWVELEGIGHSIQLDVPLEAAQLVLGWA